MDTKPQSSSHLIEQQADEANSSTSSSRSTSFIKLDELSSYEATEQDQSTAPISMKSQSTAAANEQGQCKSLPDFCANQTEANKSDCQGQVSSMPDPKTAPADPQRQEPQPTECESGFQMIDMDCGQDNSAARPSLPPANPNEPNKSDSGPSLGQPVKGLLSESLVEMITNLRSENQRLLHALETNNDYVKSRIDEFKRVTDESQRRDVQHATEKAELEHQMRKLQRQNSVMSERLKNMEAKLKDMKLEVEESLTVAHSSRASSGREDFDAKLYPNLADLNPFDVHSQRAQSELQTLQMDVANDELRQDSEPSAPPEAPTHSNRAEAKDSDYSQMTREQLSKHFDANKTAFYAIDDPMKQCDELEQQLNEVGRRDYEICLLQQQLNIYRQDFRLERMANLDAKIQIEKLKNEIDRICLERLQEKLIDAHSSQNNRKIYTNVAFPPGTSGLVGKMGRKAAKSAAKAAKYAAKQAHLEQKAAAAAAALAARHNSRQEQQKPSSGSKPDQMAAGEQHDKYRHAKTGSHHRTHRGGIRSEVVSDLWETANKAMLTGYKMASTHVNLALDKLNEYEQSQADLLAKKK